MIKLKLNKLKNLNPNKNQKKTFKKNKKNFKKKFIPILKTL